MRQTLKCKCRWLLPALLGLVSAFYMVYTLAFIPMFMWAARITEVPGGWYIAHILGFGLPILTIGLLSRIWFNYWTKARYSSCPWEK